MTAVKCYYEENGDKHYIYLNANDIHKFYKDLEENRIVIVVKSPIRSTTFYSKYYFDKVSIDDFAAKVTNDNMAITERDFGEWN